MEPIKPVEGVSHENQGQASPLAEVLRDGYWQQRAQEIPPVEAEEQAAEVTEKRRGQAQEKPAKTRHTYAEFEVNRETHEVIVRIIDADSGKLVRTIPPDQLAREIARGNFHPSQLRRRAVLV